VIQNVLHWILSGRISLPPHLEVLRLPLDGSELSPEPHAAQLNAEHQLIKYHLLKALGESHPLLREFHAGKDGEPWKRDGDSWYTSGYDKAGDPVKCVERFRMD
jgi:hypothetical protein